ncbi:VOC family protein [Viridibacillus sp. YIM B01967]|uniref:VOC family protein n=1 Tax=Viridibacillus soli TaxID=2798301 RepID=A0ABS1H5L0_9BACL|nr:VOC family protein [Viridibacillus soli]
MFELDHVVYFTTKNPQQIVEQEQIEGIHPVKGGQHLHWGTYNALFYTKNSYIEWLAVEDENIAEQSTQPLVKQLLYDIVDDEGFASLCLRSNDLEKKNRYFKKMGYRTSGIIHAERKTDSGELRKWKMLFIDHKINHTLPYPFFIEWEKSIEERYASLREDGTIKPENEELAIKRCIFHVKNVEEKLTHWSRLLSLPTKGNTLKLANTTFVFEEKLDSKERLHTIEIVKG